MQWYLRLNSSNRKLWIWMLCQLFWGERSGFWMISPYYTIPSCNTTFVLNMPLNPNKVIRVLVWDAPSLIAVILETNLLVGPKIAVPLMTVIHLSCPDVRMIQQLLQHKQLQQLPHPIRSTVKRSVWPFTVGLNKKCHQIASLDVVILSPSMISQHQESRFVMMVMLSLHLVHRTIKCVPKHF